MTPQDDARVAEVEAYGVIGAPPGRDLSALAELAAHLCDVPSAAVTLITGSGEVQIAAYGVRPSARAPGEPMCAELVRRGERIGTLCVFDSEPRELSEGQARGLRTLADRVVDVIELGRSLTRLNAIRNELRHSNEQVAVFAGQVSHDLRNPLTSVTMSLEMLREQPAVMEDDDSLWMVERALSGAKRMDALIEELLDYAMVGGGLTMDKVDLMRVMAQVRDDLAARLEGVDLHVGELPVIWGDPGQLRAVLKHLVENAVKFAGPDPVPRVTVCGAETSDGWVIEVADNGPGVPKADRERVFDLLTRGNKSIAGAGIGLATCRRAVWAHGGSIEMDESPEGGALVRIQLPNQDGAKEV